MTDHYTQQRQRWLRQVSPFHLDESRLPYLMYWCMALVFGTRMPHEAR